MMAKREESKELHPAEIAKLEAEAEAARAEVERRRAEAAKLDAERLRYDEDTLIARANRLIAETNQREVARQEARNLVDDYYRRVYRFTDSVNSTSVRRCMDRLSEWSRLSPPGEPCAMEIVFSSPGGSVIDGMALFDHIQELRRQGHFITTKALGMAASMAGILLQAGDHRVMSREAYVLIHEISAGAIGKFGEMEDEMIFLRKIQDRILDLFAQRCQATNAPKKLTRGRLAKGWRRKDWWLDSKECLEYGLVDEVA